MRVLLRLGHVRINRAQRVVENRGRDYASEDRKALRPKVGFLTGGEGALLKPGFFTGVAANVLGWGKGGGQGTGPGQG